MHKLSYRVTEPQDGLTLRTLLKRELGVSTALLQKLKATDGVRVEGVLRYMSERVSAGERVDIHLPTEAQTDAPVERGPLCILYFDEWLMAVEKPAPMLTHPSLKQHTGTLVSLALGALDERGEPLTLHPVNRLDRDTSGIVLFARHGFAHAHLMEQMKKGQVQKRYLGLVYGRLPEGEGQVDLPIGRASDSFLTRQVDPAGSSAQTKYRVREEMLIGGEPVSLVDLYPITGRTHQLRVHCLALDAPLVGDTQYETPASRAFRERYAVQGQLLHAEALSFLHPATREPVTVQSPMTRHLALLGRA